MICNDCGEEIDGCYTENDNGTYTCLACEMSREDGLILGLDFGDS